MPESSQTPESTSHSIQPEDHSEQYNQPSAPMNAPVEHDAAFDDDRAGLLDSFDDEGEAIAIVDNLEDIVQSGVTIETVMRRLSPYWVVANLKKFTDVGAVDDVNAYLNGIDRSEVLYAIAENLPEIRELGGDIDVEALSDDLYEEDESEFGVHFVPTLLEAGADVERIVKKLDFDGVRQNFSDLLEATIKKGATSTDLYHWVSPYTAVTLLDQFIEAGVDVDGNELHERLKQSGNSMSIIVHIDQLIDAGATFDVNEAFRDAFEQNEGEIDILLTLGLKKSLKVGVDPNLVVALLKDKNLDYYLEEYTPELAAAGAHIA